MPSVIYRYTAEQGCTELVLHEGAEFLSAGYYPDSDEFCVWCRIDKSKPVKKFEILHWSTGRIIEKDDWKFIATISVKDKTVGGEGTAMYTGHFFWREAD